MIDIEKRKDIRKHLRKHHGAFALVAERAGVTYEMVRLVLTGRRENEQVLLEAVKVWKEKEEEKAAAEREIDALFEEAQLLANA
jgi:hypothetical protein